nr:GNAT family acetyltransferase [uncultured Devosia sp.]
MQIRAFAAADTEAVVALWQACGLVRPWNDPHKDIARKGKVQPELFLVGELDGAVIATAMGGYDGHRGSVYYMAVSPAHQGKRYGATLLAQLETLLLAVGCPKINLMVRAGNPVADFYNGLGYSLETSACYGKRLIPDE